MVLVRARAQHPDLPLDDPNKAFVAVPDFYETARTGLHYLLPVIVLIWCLMVEEMSPGLAAFWGVVAMAAVVLTQRPLTAFFRGEARARGAMRCWAVREFLDGLANGARNMTAVGIATATAGILVGMVTLTGIGLVMTEIVEFLSGGSIVIMLVLVGVICIILGSGLPTTASYVVVATLMAPVVVEIAARERSRGAADRRAHVRVLFRPDGGRLAAGRACRLCGRRDRRRRSDEGRLAGHMVRVAHAAAAVHLHLQSRDADDRHRRAAAFHRRRRLLRRSP